MVNNENDTHGHFDCGFISHKGRIFLHQERMKQTNKQKTINVTREYNQKSKMHIQTHT